jgi:hypothetical protein
MIATPEETLSLEGTFSMESMMGSFKGLQDKGPVAATVSPSTSSFAHLSKFFDTFLMEDEEGESSISAINTQVSTVQAPPPPAGLPPAGLPPAGLLPAGLLPAGLSVPRVSSLSVAPEVAVVPIVLTLVCSFLRHSDVDSVKVVSNIFGNWDSTHALVMRRSMSNPEVWRASVNIHVAVRSNSTFLYNYIIIDKEIRTWQHSAPTYSIQVDAPTSSLSLATPVERQDFFKQGHLLKSRW